MTNNAPSSGGLSPGESFSLLLIDAVQWSSLLSTVNEEILGYVCYLIHFEILVEKDLFRRSLSMKWSESTAQSKKGKFYVDHRVRQWLATMVFITSTCHLHLASNRTVTINSSAASTMIRVRLMALGVSADKTIQNSELWRSNLTAASELSLDKWLDFIPPWKFPATDELRKMQRNYDDLPKKRPAYSCCCWL